MALASFICNLLLGAESVFLASSPGPGARLADFDVEVAHAEPASYLSAAWYLEAELQLPARTANASRFGLPQWEHSEAFQVCPCGFSLQECQVYYGLFPALF